MRDGVSYRPTYRITRANGWRDILAKCSNGVSLDERSLIHRLGRRSPSPLLFAVSASFHAAPLPMLTLTRIDKIDIAIRRTTFSNLHAVNVDKQVLHSNCTGMKRDFGRQHVRPSVACQGL
jgi:hypothetical protein